MTGLVAITGATGFVGARCVHHLAAAGWRIRILTRRMPQAALMPDHKIEVVLGDLDDQASLRQLVAGADAILHCAGLVKAPTPEAFFAANVGGTEHLLLAAAQAAPRARLIHISSLAAREPHLSPYAASKQAGEIKVAGLAGPRDWITLRPPVVYGPGDHELLPLFKAAKLGFVAYPAAPGARVATIHVADLAEAIVALLAAPNWAERQIEIDDGATNAHDWPGILSALGKAVGRAPRAWRLPRPLLMPIAAGVTLFSHLTGQPKVLSLRKVAEIYHPDWVARGPSLSRVANWQPQFSLDTGFADTAAWYRSQALL
ncbi:NAD-dependent epimerase/dehydratase family protein [Dongia sp.]|uniref:NAD-dependent epimerase/dehydratase family protein n=1 Tax=Dongia sp. TaxID=1977262 RepID=UPI0035AF4771